MKNINEGPLTQRNKYLDERGGSLWLVGNFLRGFLAEPWLMVSFCSLQMRSQTVS
jgi:hypothetical protein